MASNHVRTRHHHACAGLLQVNICITRKRACVRPLAGGVAARESGGDEPGAPPGVDMPDMGRDWASRLATMSSGSSNFTDSELDTARRSGIAAQDRQPVIHGVCTGPPGVIAFSSDFGMPHPLRPTFNPTPW